MTCCLHDTSRAVLRLTGPDGAEFLQGLVSNDMRRLGVGAPLYAALLNPQGKYLADFLAIALPGGDILLDVAAVLAEGFARRLGMYRLRRAVGIAPSGLSVTLLWGQGATVPDAAVATVPDPRHPGLGLRAYGACLPDTASPADYAALRVALMVPDAGTDLVPEDSYILESGFERLHGVDFRKGCYVGQEVTARMKHKTDLRRGLVRVGVEGVAVPGTAVLSAGREVGRLGTVAGREALALLRLDRLPEANGDGLTAGEARLRVLAPPSPEA